MVVRYAAVASRSCVTPVAPAAHHINGRGSDGSSLTAPPLPADTRNRRRWRGRGRIGDRLRRRRCDDRRRRRSEPVAQAGYQIVRRVFGLVFEAAHGPEGRIDRAEIAVVQVEDDVRAEIVADAGDRLVAELPLRVLHDFVQADRPQAFVLPDGADAAADMRRYTPSPCQGSEIVNGIGHDRVGSAIPGRAPGGGASGYAAAQTRRQPTDRRGSLGAVLEAELLLEAPGAPFNADATADIVAVVEPLLEAEAGADNAAARVIETGITALDPDVVGHRSGRQRKPLCLGIRPGESHRKGNTRA